MFYTIPTSTLTFNKFIAFFTFSAYFILKSQATHMNLAELRVDNQNIAFLTPQAAQWIVIIHFQAIFNLDW